MSFVVGLTGGIGSGKSTVAELFVQHGAALVDTDAIAHTLTAPQGAAMAAIRNAFGERVLRADGGLDRAAMRSLVFSDHTAKATLEAILHPLIREHSEARCADATSAPYVLLVVPLLIESGSYRRRADRILVVDCDEAVQIARVMTRSGLTAGEVEAIMATQASRLERRAAADDVVLNDRELDALAPQVDGLHRQYLELAMAKAHAGR
ncbi:MAG: dephospho-CoA kinase [Candidatus Accumulibacter propinquus]|jgi:dephospho-CoA kinase|uniref:dephospho-CoA kinase n=1 Tax=Candidatus Accumulibacter TaxID=327159 RepID=UPI001ACA2D86|nr:dephospho-CoA kinase [Accumulibacter sp.]MBK8387232.1 dephospho-CoA kinase [Accumulibacter sp.]MBK8578407.1 dephospho-CoA kinase [Candidatus Accumulibacter propinquus]MBN8439974.1 dephospho-CoA kinase [Accumulibacter sp.]